MTPEHGEVMKWGSALDWAFFLTSALAVLILVGIGVSLLFHRGRQTEGSALWVHLLSLGVLPLFLLAVGNFAVFEYATEQRFCGTCHLTMAPYIEDLRNPDSQSLAALHYQNRFARETECYACHANYGVHGTFEAKLTGLRHVYKYVTRTYHIPIEMPHPFGNGLCLKCHNGAKRFMAEESHLEGGHVAPDLVAGDLECIACHGPAHEVDWTPKQAAAGRRAAR